MSTTPIFNRINSIYLTQDELLSCHYVNNNQLTNGLSSKVSTIGSFQNISGSYMTANTGSFQNILLNGSPIQQNNTQNITGVNAVYTNFSSQNITGTNLKISA